MKVIIDKGSIKSLIEWIIPPLNGSSKHNIFFFISTVIISRHVGTKFSPSAHCDKNCTGYTVGTFYA